MKIEQTSVTRKTAAVVKDSVVQAVGRLDSELDWSAVRVVDSSAVAVLLAWLRRAQTYGLAPKVFGVPEKLLSLAKLYGTYDLVKPYLAERQEEKMTPSAKP